MNTAILAFAIDCAIGDPRSSLHPVVLIGKLISLFEAMLYREDDSDNVKFLKGMLLMILVLIISYEAAEGIMHLAYKFHNEYVTWAVGALLLSFTISPRTLSEAGREIREPDSRRSDGCCLRDHGRPEGPGCGPGGGSC